MTWITRKLSPGGEVGVEPRAEVQVKLLRAVDIHDGDVDHLEPAAARERPAVTAGSFRPKAMAVARCDRLGCRSI